MPALTIESALAKCVVGGWSVPQGLKEMDDQFKTFWII